MAGPYVLEYYREVEVSDIKHDHVEHLAVCTLRSVADMI